MSGLLLVSVFLLMVTVAWSLYDEFYGLRPWRGYQRDFVGSYESYLNMQIAEEKKVEAALYSAPEYLKLKADADAQAKAVAPTDRQIAQQLALLEQRRVRNRSGQRQVHQEISFAGRE